MHASAPIPHLDIKAPAVKQLSLRNWPLRLAVWLYCPSCVKGKKPPLLITGAVCQPLAPQQTVQKPKTPQQAPWWETLVNTCLKLTPCKHRFLYHQKRHILSWNITQNYSLCSPYYRKSKVWLTGSQFWYPSLTKPSSVIYATDGCWTADVGSCAQNPSTSTCCAT